MVSLLAVLDSMRLGVNGVRAMFGFRGSKLGIHELRKEIDSFKEAEQEGSKIEGWFEIRKRANKD